MGSQILTIMWTKHCIEGIFLKCAIFLQFSQVINSLQKLTYKTLYICKNWTPWKFLHYPVVNSLSLSHQWGEFQSLGYPHCWGEHHRVAKGRVKAEWHWEPVGWPWSLLYSWRCQWQSEAGEESCSYPGEIRHGHCVSRQQSRHESDSDRCWRNWQHFGWTGWQSHGSLNQHFLTGPR